MPGTRDKRVKTRAVGSVKEITYEFEFNPELHESFKKRLKLEKAKGTRIKELLKPLSLDSRVWMVSRKKGGEEILSLDDYLPIPKNDETSAITLVISPLIK